MFHQLAKAVGRRPLFCTWGEARVLWDAVVAAATPGLVALVLLPDQLQLLHEADVRLLLAARLSGYTRWRNHARNQRDLVFRRLPPARAVQADRTRVGVRYLHTLPCREKLVSDPLAWPFSTHRDACGLALPPAVRRVRHVESFHRRTSSEPCVSDGGSRLPAVKLQARDPLQVLRSVSALTRTPLSAMRHRCPARTLFMRTAMVTCPEATAVDVATLVGVHRNTVLEAAKHQDPNVKLVMQVLGDPRFGALHDRRLFFGTRYAE